MNTLRQELVDDGWLDPSGGVASSFWCRAVFTHIMNPVCAGCARAIFPVSGHE